MLARLQRAGSEFFARISKCAVGAIFLKVSVDFAKSRFDLSRKLRVQLVDCIRNKEIGIDSGKLHEVRSDRHIEGV